MKNIIYLYILLTFFSCDYNKEDGKKIYINDSLEINIGKEIKCDCSKYFQEKYSTFQYEVIININHSEIKDSVIIIDREDNAYSLNDPRIDSSINQIKISNLNIIPIQLKRFKQINRIKVCNTDSINVGNLCLFSNLKEVSFQLATNIYINPNDNWLESIQVLEIDRCIFNGIKKLSDFKNLKTLYLFYTGLRNIEKDFNSLKCIQSISIIGYVGRDSINLRSIDLKELNCLNSIQVEDVYGNIKGVPENLKVRSLEKLKIKSINLTEQEKLELKINSR